MPNVQGLKLLFVKICFFSYKIILPATANLFPSSNDPKGRQIIKKRSNAINAIELSPAKPEKGEK